MPNIYSLSQIGDTDLEKIGYRAWSLAKAHQNKFQVPLSFIVPNHVFEEFLTQNRLLIEIRKILAGIQYEDLEELKKAYPKIKEEFSKAKIPEEFLDQLKDAYSSMAVPQEGKSAEDLLIEEDATINLIASPDYKCSSDDIKGLIMNLKGFNAFIIGLKSAWLSLYTPEQINLRHRKGIKEFNMGVLVQRMINAEVTIEAFSKGPLGDYEIIVKSYQGLPDITSSITKDVHSVSKEYLKIESGKIIRQEFKIIKGERNGSLEKRTLGSRGEEQKLPDKEILEAARISKRMFSILGSDFKVFFGVRKSQLSIMLINLFPDQIQSQSDSDQKILVSKAALAPPISTPTTINLDEDYENVENGKKEVKEVKEVKEENHEESILNPDESFGIGEEIVPIRQPEEQKEQQIKVQSEEKAEEQNEYNQEEQEITEYYDEQSKLSENIEIIDEEVSEKPKESNLESPEEPVKLEIYNDSYEDSTKSIQNQDNQKTKSAQEILEEIEREESRKEQLNEGEVREESEKRERDEILGDDDFILSDKEED